LSGRIADLDTTVDVVDRRILVDANEHVGQLAGCARMSGVAPLCREIRNLTTSDAGSPKGEKPPLFLASYYSGADSCTLSSSVFHHSVRAGSRRIVDAG